LTVTPPWKLFTTAPVRRSSFFFAYAVGPRFPFSQILCPRIQIGGTSKTIGPLRPVGVLFPNPQCCFFFSNPLVCYSPKCHLIKFLARCVISWLLYCLGLSVSLIQNFEASFGVPPFSARSLFFSLLTPRVSVHQLSTY